MSDMHAKDLLVEPAIRALLHTNNYIAARDLFFRFAIEIVLMIALYRTVQLGSYLVGFLIFYILAIWHSFWGYAGIGHELLHGRVFSNKNLNKVLYCLASFFVWSNPVFFKASHFYHHSRTFAEDDAESKGMQKWEWKDILFYLTIDIPFMTRRLFYTVINSIGFKYVDEKFYKIDKSYAIAASLTLIFQLVINLLIYYVFHDLLLNFLWIILPFTAQFFNRLLAQSQHIGLGAYCDLGPLRYSRTVHLPKLVSYLYAGMNYHAEHHLIPSIPYYNLQKLSEFLIRFHDHKIENWRFFCTRQFVNLVRNK